MSVGPPVVMMTDGAIASRIRAIEIYETLGFDPEDDSGFRLELADLRTEQRRRMDSPERAAWRGCHGLAWVQSGNAWELVDEETKHARVAPYGFTWDVKVFTCRPDHSSVYVYTLGLPLSAARLYAEREVCRAIGEEWPCGE